MAQAKKRILIVEPDDRIRSLLAKSLDGLNYDCIQQENATGAIGEISSRLDLAVVDIDQSENRNLVDMIKDGMGTPVIVMTSNPNVRDASGFVLEKRAVAYVSKPGLPSTFPIDDIIKLIEVQTKIRQREREGVKYEEPRELLVVDDNSLFIRFNFILSPITFLSVIPNAPPRTKSGA